MLLQPFDHNYQSVQVKQDYEIVNKVVVLNIENKFYHGSAFRFLNLGHLKPGTFTLIRCFANSKLKNKIRITTNC